MSTPTYNPNKATVHLVSSQKMFWDLQREMNGDDESSGDEMNDDWKFSIPDLNRSYPGLLPRMKRGDIIEDIDKSGDRSYGITMFNGTDIVDQEDLIDDYGSPNSEFKVITEFPIWYWHAEEGYPLNVNSDFEPGRKSEFYWHSEDPIVAIDPHGLQLSMLVRDHLKREDGKFFVGFIYLGEGYLIFFNEIHPDPNEFDSPTDFFIEAHPGTFAFQGGEEPIMKKYEIPERNVGGIISIKD